MSLSDGWTPERYLNSIRYPDPAINFVEDPEFQAAYEAEKIYRAKREKQEKERRKESSKRYKLMIADMRRGFYPYQFKHHVFCFRRKEKKERQKRTFARIMEISAQWNKHGTFEVWTPEMQEREFNEEKAHR